MSDLDAVLWDLDGTLIDSEPYWHVAERRLAAEFDVPWGPEHEAALVGVDLWDGARMMIGLGVRMDADAIVQRFAREVTERLEEHVPFRPGAGEMLVALAERDVPTALVTMSTRSIVDVVLGAMRTQLGIEPFATTIAGDEVSRGKPFPDPYLQGLEALGARPDSSVAFEDSVPGTTAARDAGIRTVGVPHGTDLADIAGITLWPTLVGRTVDDVRGLVVVRA